MATCEIEGCGRRANSQIDGVRTCERCRIEFGSVGWGAVYFGGRWHGVKGATYTPEQVAAHPGLRARRVT